MNREPITYLPHVAPFSIVETDGGNFVVLSNNNGRHLTLYDPANGVKYQPKSTVMYLIETPFSCAQKVVRHRLWLKWGDFNIAPPNCDPSQSLLKLAWYYSMFDQFRIIRTMRHGLDGKLRQLYDQECTGFLDRGGQTKSQTLRSLLSLHAVFNLGIKSHEEGVPIMELVESQFQDALRLVAPFSLHRHLVGDLQEFSLVIHNGEVGYITDYSAPPKLLVLAHMGYEITIYTHQAVFVLMTPSQNAHAVLHFDLAGPPKPSGDRS